MLRVRGLEKSYGKVRALKGISFQVNDGEVFALVGPNGAGKTTTLKAIMGLVKYGGDITMDGSPLDERTRVERISFLPEEKRLYDSLSVEKMIGIALETVPSIDPRKLEELVERFSIPMRDKVLELSHGNRTLLYLAITMSKDASLYLLDEPTWGLDPHMRREVFDLMNETVLEGKSVLYTSHVLPEVEKMADRLAVLKEGQIVFQESLESLRSTYRLFFTKERPRVGFFKEVEGGYLVLARGDEMEGNGTVPSLEDIFDMVVEGERA